MNFIKKIAMSALMAGSFATPVAAQDRTVPADLVLTEAMVPYIYQYAACVFGGPGSTAEARIAACSDTKGRLLAESEDPFIYWHRGKGPTRNRQFARAFTQLDTEARVLESHYGPVPATISAYMDCLGSIVADTDAFIAGRAIDYVGFDEVCRDQADFSFATASDLERRLYQGVRRNGRVVRVPLSPMISYELDRGLLGARYY